MWPRHPFDVGSVNVFCAGSSSGYSLRRENYIHFVELDVGKGKISDFRVENLIWVDDKRGDPSFKLLNAVMKIDKWTITVWNIKIVFEAYYFI